MEGLQLFCPQLELRRLAERINRPADPVALRAEASASIAAITAAIGRCKRCTYCHAPMSANDAECRRCTAAVRVNGSVEHRDRPYRDLRCGMCGSPPRVPHHTSCPLWQ